MFASGSSMRSGLEAGFPRGMAAPTTQSASYLVSYRFTVARKDGAASRTITCQARRDGQVSQFTGQDLQHWAPLIQGAREQCLTQLVGKLKADRGS